METPEIPQEWIDKLFNCMESFYGEKWTIGLNEPYKIARYKTIWRSGLRGLTYDEIKQELVRQKHIASEIPMALPPHVLEFYRYAKKMG